MNKKKAKHGGRRPNSGRKRIHSKGVAHRRREFVAIYKPLHINFKVKTAIRNKTCLKILKRAIRNARTHGLKVLHFSLESNHVHLIVEATNNEILTRGMRSLTITFAKRIDQGRIQLGRYHLHVLKTLRATKNAIHYVLFNHQKHTRMKRAYVSEYNSLGFIKDLRRLAMQRRTTIVLRKLAPILFLDQPQSWMAQKVLAG